MSHIFISYSRKDIEFAQKIVDALAVNDLDTWIDWKSIPKGEDWVLEINRGIEEADAFLFLISSDSVVADGCNKEIEHAVKNGKRILPIVIRDTDPKIIHPEISKRNWIFCRDGQDDFNKAVEETRETIHTDYEWLKYHTKLQIKALDWEREKDGSRLLWGKELREAEEQLAKAGSLKDPQPTELYRNYVLASQRNEVRQRRQVTIGLSFGLAIVGVLAVFSWTQRNIAVAETHSRATAEANAIAEANSRATAQSNAEQQARISRAGELIAEAISLRDIFPERSLLLAAESARVSLDSGENLNTRTEEDLRILLDTPIGFPLQNPTLGQREVSPDNRWLFFYDVHGFQLWDLHHPQPWLRPSSQEQLPGIQSVKFIRASNLLLIASESRVELWNLSGANAALQFEVKAESDLICDAFTNSNGDWLVISACSGAIEYLDTKSIDLNPLQLTVEKPKVYAYDHVSSPDGNWFALYEPGAGGQLWSFTPTSGPKLMYSDDTNWQQIMFSLNNQYVFVVKDDQTEKHLYAIDLSKTKLSPLELSNLGGLSDVLFSEDGHWIAAIKNNSFEDQIEIGIIDLAKPSIANIPRIHKRNKSSSLVSFKNQWLIFDEADTASETNLIMWNLSDVQSYDDPSTFKADSYSYYQETSPDGHWLISMPYRGAIKLWNLDEFDANPVTLSGQNALANYVLYAANHKWIATLSDDKAIRLWNLDTLESDNNPRLLFGHDTEFDGGFFSIDDQWIVSHELNGITRVWNFSDNDQTNNSVQNLYSSAPSIVLKGHEQFISALALTSDSRWLASGDMDGVFRLWDLGENPIQSTINIQAFNQRINDVKISPNGRWLAVAGDGQEVLLWDLNRQINSEPPYRLNGHTNAVDVLAFSGNSHVLASGGADGKILLWELNANGPGQYPVELCCHSVNDIDGGHGVSALAFSPDGSLMVSGDVSGKGALWKLTDMRQPILILQHSDYAPVISATFSHSGEFIAIGGSDFRTTIWDIKMDPPLYSTLSPETSGIVELRGTHDSGIIGVVFSSDDQQLITISTLISQETDNHIYFWNMNDVIYSAFSPNQELKGPEAKISSWAISLDHKSLAVGSGNTTINGPYASLYVWNLQNLTAPPIKYPGNAFEIRSILFSNDGKSLVAAGTDIYIYSLEQQNLLKVVCYMAARNLTKFEWQSHFPGVPYRETCTNLPIMRETSISSPDSQPTPKVASSPTTSSGEVSRSSLYLLITLCCFCSLASLIIGFVFIRVRKLRRK